MKHSFKRQSVALTLLPLAMVCADAAAETITFTARTTDSSETKSLPGNPCSINQELTQVVITSSARGFGDYRVENTSSTSFSETVVTQNLVELSIKVPGLPGGDTLINQSVGPLVSNVVLQVGEFLEVDPSFDSTFSQPPPAREFTDPTELAFFDVAAFDVDFKGDASDNCSFTTGNSVCTINTFVEGSATVTYSCTDLEPALRCDGKTLSPAVLAGPDGNVEAAFTIRNTGDVDFVNILQITDTMDAKMTLTPGTVVPIGNPAGGPSPAPYTWSGLSLNKGESLNVTYSADITGLSEGETVCNTVVASANGTTSNACRACVSRRGEPPPVPAIGPMGVAVLGGALAWFGLLFGFRRRNSH